MSMFTLISIWLLILVISQSPVLVFVILLTLCFVFLLISCSCLSHRSSLLSLLLFLLSLVVSVFLVTSSLFIFFMIYELSLVPVCLMILLFGYQPEKLNAILWLLLYTVVCSTPFLYFSVVNFYSVSFGISTLSPFASFLVCLSFIANAPLYTLHSWLPKAHVEAPLLGSMLLAGIMLNLGGYGLLLASPSLSPPCVLYLYFSVTGGVICSVICFRTWDMKSLVAYSSVVHIGIVTICVLSGTELGFTSSLWIMVSHSLISPIMFVLAYEFYSYAGSRSFIFGHSSSLSPSLLFCMSICSGVSFGLPPFMSFWVEVAIYSSIGSFSSLFIMPLLLASFLTFLYSLCFYLFSCGGSSSPTTTSVGFLFPYISPLSYSLLIIFC